MKRVQSVYFATMALLTLAWLLADPVLTVPYEFFALRASLVNLTGLLGLGAMSVGMLMAMRPVALEPPLGGLDKMYRLHKWLGITGLVLSIVHWLLAKGPKWMIGWGWMERPVRRRAPPPEEAIFQFFQAQRGLAEEIGEFAFYALVVLLVVALVKRFPYRWFFQTHRLLAVVYLALVVHSVVLMKFSYWGAVTGPLMAVLMAAGSVAAVRTLLRRVGERRRAVGVIDELVRHPDNRVLQVGVQLQDHWPGHEAGQFAFVTFDPHEGAHPFTLSSAWHGDGHITFLIKGLGDYTQTLPERLALGDAATVEGPYGRFAFAGGGQRQIWVAGGIGIAPFMARLEALARQPDGRPVDLFYSTSAPDQGFIAQVRQRAQAAGARLHLLVPGNEPLTTDRICHTVPQWAQATVWFCGPAGFGQALRQGFVARGLAPARFHQELFNLR